MWNFLGILALLSFSFHTISEGERKGENLSKEQKMDDDTKPSPQMLLEGNMKNSRKPWEPLCSVYPHRASLF